MTCPHCAALQARVVELEYRLALCSRMDRTNAIRADLGVNVAEARLLIRLARSGSVVPKSAVMDALETRSPDSMKTRVSVLRRKLRVGTVVAERGGYRATPQLIEAVNASLSD